MYKMIAEEYEVKSWFQKQNYSRSEITLLIRLRSGHALSYHKLFIMNLRINDVCECGLASGTLHHMLLGCELYKIERSRLFQDLRCIGFQFPVNLPHIVCNPSPKIASALFKFVSRTKMKL